MAFSRRDDLSDFTIVAEIDEVPGRPVTTRRRERRGAAPVVGAVVVGFVAVLVAAIAAVGLSARSGHAEDPSRGQPTPARTAPGTGCIRQEVF